MDKIEILYGKLEGTEGQFTRDPTGFLMLATDIFQKRGLDVHYRHAQGTEERYRELEEKRANISLVVGRTALKHFLETEKTRLLGCSINSCPYRLVVQSKLQTKEDLRGSSLACRKSTAHKAPLVEGLKQWGNLTVGEDIILQLPATDKEALDMLYRGEVYAALLPQPHAIIAEEKGFRRMIDWPDFVDDPLPLVLETTARQFSERPDVFRVFLEAYREGITYLKKNRDEAIKMLRNTFAQSPFVAAKAFDDYLPCLNGSLTVNKQCLEKLLEDIAPGRRGGASLLAATWIVS